MNVALGEVTALSGAIPANSENQKQIGAAQDFEALLIGQMLHSLREEGSGWLGTGDDDAGAVAFGFGEDQLARALTKGGGLGLSKIIAEGLAARSAQAEKASATVDGNPPVRP